MTDYQAGDFFTTKRNTFIGLLIRIVTKSSQSHAGVILSDTGTIIEALTSGASIRNISKYKNYRIHHVNMSEAVRNSVVYAAQQSRGIPYGFLDILSIGLLQYGIKPKWLREKVAHQRNAICSQLVDRIYLLAGIHLFNDGRIPQDVTPGDLDRLPLIVENQGVK